MNHFNYVLFIYLLNFIAGIGLTENYVFLFFDFK